MVKFETQSSRINGEYKEKQILMDDGIAEILKKVKDIVSDINVRLPELKKDLSELYATKENAYKKMMDNEEDDDAYEEWKVLDDQYELLDSTIDKLENIKERLEDDD